MLLFYDMLFLIYGVEVTALQRNISSRNTKNVLHSELLAEALC